jgi:hypothetical protein
VVADTAELESDPNVLIVDPKVDFVRTLEARNGQKAS